ncbi:hypothetical protein JIM95_009215 [Corynebacterium sp. CCM 8835]|nr:hypothetical protein [Corynebacterium antarcticum]MCL0246311.1 hypothetical protein [Corynebacterium antarcticum]MCX7540905.1 hypothetical protein [Corynebacterium antarcticum]
MSSLTVKWGSPIASRYSVLCRNPRCADAHSRAVVYPSPSVRGELVVRVAERADHRVRCLDDAHRPVVAVDHDLTRGRRGPGIGALGLVLAQLGGGGGFLPAENRRDQGIAQRSRERELAGGECGVGRCVRQEMISLCPVRCPLFYSTISL